MTTTAGLDGELARRHAALLDILAAVTDTPIAALETRYDGAGYGTFKRDVLDAVVTYLEPIQTRYHELRADPDAVHDALAKGAEKARVLAVPTMERVRDVVGLLPAR